MRSKNEVSAKRLALRHKSRQDSVNPQSGRARYCICAGLLIFVAVSIVTGCKGAKTKSPLTIKYYYTQTDDGITLSFRRYQPIHLSENKEPVILCHGLSYNLLFWDLGEEVSLPRYLAEAGYDVWSLSLRGAAPSSQPLNSAMRKLARFQLEPQMLKNLKRRLTDLKMFDWSVDQHIQYDVPAALRFIREQAKREKVHWIGHSMGGMIMFAYLGQNPEGTVQQIKSFVAIAVPMVMLHPLNDPLSTLLRQEPALKIGSRILGSSAPATLGAIFGDLGLPRDRLFYNSENIDDSILRVMFQKAEEEISPRQWKQLFDMMRSEHFHSLDRKIDYTEALSSVNVPTYMLVGATDNLSTPGDVRHVYRQLTVPDKQFRLFGRINSHRNNYGHNDMIIGRHATEEVYPTILRWLRKHSDKPEEPYEEDSSD